MERPLESRTISQAIHACKDLLKGLRIVVVMGDRLALSGICLAPFIAPGLVGGATTDAEGLQLVQRMHPELLLLTEDLEIGYGIRSDQQAKFVEQLSEREKEVVCAVARGLTNGEIATAFQISAETVKSHVSNCMSKLAVRDRTQLAVSALMHGLINPQEV